MAEYLILTDESPMPQSGKWSGVAMKEVPDEYLQWLVDNNRCSKSVQAYITWKKNRPEGGAPTPFSYSSKALNKKKAYKSKLPFRDYKVDSRRFGSGPNKY